MHVILRGTEALVFGSRPGSGVHRVTETTTVIVLRPYPEVVRVIQDELAQRLVVIHIKIDAFQCNVRQRDRGL